ncbi:MAG: hypothetical protein R6U42_02485 [Halomonas sp.]
MAVLFWKEINNLPKTGQISPAARIGRGDAPHRLRYVQPDATLGHDLAQQRYLQKMRPARLSVPSWLLSLDAAVATPIVNGL